MYSGKMFKIASIVTLIIGFISGGLVSAPKSGFEGFISTLIMFAILSLSFWAVYCHLDNQNTISSQLHNLDKNLALMFNEIQEQNKEKESN